MHLLRKIALAIALLVPLAASAHGGVEHVVGNATVSLGQHPLSPLVGEEIEMAFTFIRKDTTSRLAGMDVKLSVIDTFHGDESKDVVIRTETLKTDVNGVIEYVAGPFDKENYFDVEMTFADPVTGEPLKTGFLVEPRALPIPLSPPTLRPSPVPQYFGWIGMAMIVAAYAAVTSKKADPRDRRVLALNLLGSVGIGASVYVQQAWPALALQLVWGAIAIAGLFKARRTP